MGGSAVGLELRPDGLQPGKLSPARQDYVLLGNKGVKGTKSCDGTNGRLRCQQDSLLFLSGDYNS